MSEELPPEALVPGAMRTEFHRQLPGGLEVFFEEAPKAWTKADGTVRAKDHRRYDLVFNGGPRERVPSVTTICEGVIPKDLKFWAEGCGIRGALEAVRTGLVSPSASGLDACREVRHHKLGFEGVRAKAAARGLSTHSMLEDFLRDGTVPNPSRFPAAHRPFMTAAARWLVDVSPDPVAIELLVVDPKLGYAGRADLLCMIDGALTLVDFKTSYNGAIYESAILQVALLRDAENRFGVHHIERLLVVALTGDGGVRELAVKGVDGITHDAVKHFKLLKRLQAQTRRAVAR